MCVCVCVCVSVYYTVLVISHSVTDHLLVVISQLLIISESTKVEINPEKRDFLKKIQYCTIQIQSA